MGARDNRFGQEIAEELMAPIRASSQKGGLAGLTPSEQIDRRIAELADWRGEVLGSVRRLIHEAVPDVVEEWKWMGTPVWSREGILCTGETYKAIVKLTFAKGASLPDPAGLFNSSLEGRVRRAIDIREGEDVDGDAFQQLIRAAVDFNASRPARANSRRRPR